MNTRSYLLARISLTAWLSLRNHSSIFILRFQKNIFEIVKIAKICQDYTFIIIGNGPLYKEIINLINYEKIRNVILTGCLDNVYSFLRNSDIFLSTSLYEGLPISVLEAMSAGLPILASKVIGNIDTIEDGKSGYFYDLGDVINYEHQNIPIEICHGEEVDIGTTIYLGNHNEGITVLGLASWG